jgi:hypothetical protein
VFCPNFGDGDLKAREHAKILHRTDQLTANLRETLIYSLHGRSMRLV